jgi:hypothetical protein
MTEVQFWLLCESAAFGRVMKKLSGWLAGKRLWQARGSCWSFLLVGIHFRERRKDKD